MYLHRSENRTPREIASIVQRSIHAVNECIKRNGEPSKLRSNYFHNNPRLEKRIESLYKARTYDDVDPSAVRREFGSLRPVDGNALARRIRQYDSLLGCTANLCVEE